MDIKKTLIGAGVISLLIGIGLWLKFQAELSGKLIYGIRGSVIKKFTPKQIDLEFFLTIDNPTELIVGVNGIDIDVYANGVKVTNIFNQVPTTINPNGNTSIPLRMSFNPNTLIQNTGVLLQTGLNIENVVLTMKGTIKVNKFGLNLKVPFTYTATYKELMG